MESEQRQTYEANRPDSRMPITAIGGGEGSLSALAAFFGALPANTGMAFIVLQRTSAEGDLTEYLRGHTTMPVVATTELTTLLQPDHIFAIPPDKCVVIDDGTLTLSERDTPAEQAAPIDLLFRTLATIHGPESAGVVLSGGGSDGCMGLQRVKEMGGLTLAQDPMEAEVGAMPRHAVATGMVDIVLPAAELPAKLIDYWRRTAQSQASVATPLQEASDEEVLLEIFALLRVRTGHDFSQYKRSTILRRLGRRMGVTNADTLATYLTVLRDSVEETRALLRDFLISVTNFFRDREAWGALEAVIPRLFSGKQAGDQVRVWVTGCATGEEAYSVAILLHEHAALLDEPPTIQVFATDIDDDAIITARQGIYRETIAIDVEPSRLRRYFIAEAGHYRIKQEIRDLVLFAPHNILRDPPFSRLDLVTCRNVLIYLNRTVQDQVLRLFHFALGSDGYLLLGTSESTDGVPDLFSPVDRALRLFQRRPILNVAPFQTADLLLPRPQPPVRRRPLADEKETRPSIGALHQRLIVDHAPPSILLNAENEIVHITAGAGHFLQFGAGEPSQSVLDVALPDLRLELRTALYAAGQNSGQVVTRRFPARLPGQDGQQLIEMTVRPIRQPDWASNYSLVELREIDAVEEFTRHTSSDVEPMVRQLESELQRTKDQLRLTIEQYETAVEEYRAANEELQAMNEEARAASEELETSKEELQSANEELTTLNQALKHSLQEAKRSSNDLQNLMAATEIGTIFLDRELRIKRYTPSAQALFNLLPADIDRPLTHITHRLHYAELLQDAERVRNEHVRIEREAHSANGQWYLAKIVPYRTSDEAVAGLVLTFVNITARKESEAERERLLADEQRARAEAEEAVQMRDQFLSVASHELRTPLTALQGYATMLQRRLDDGKSEPARSSRMAHTIARQAERLNTLIEQLLDTTRLQKGQFELDRQPLDLNPFIERAVEEFRLSIPTEEDGPGLTVDLAASEGPVMILGDAGRLESVLQNLFGNAVKYSPDGGTISIRLSRSRTEALIEVEDRGIGIPTDALTRLFEPFFRAQNVRQAGVGFGIGLYVVNEIVRRHGGRVEVTSTEGQGSLFRVSLPLLDTFE